MGTSDHWWNPLLHHDGAVLWYYNSSSSYHILEAALLVALQTRCEVQDTQLARWNLGFPDDCRAMG